MKQILALMTVLLGSAPVYGANREEARVWEAAYHVIQRHQVTERYRYYVPVSAFAQRRKDEPRAHTTWQARQQPLAPASDPVW